MKHTFNYILAGIILICAGLPACKKMADTPEGASKIYFTAAITPTFVVPGAVKNYIAEKETKQLHVPLYIFRSGIHKTERFSVNVIADNEAAQRLIDESVVDPSKAVIAPADLYTLPSTAEGGYENSSFEAVFDANKLTAYLGKQLILCVRMTNPTKFELNEKLSVINIVVDVDAVMLGAKMEVTNEVLKNTIHPFKTTSYDGVRRGVLADWYTSPSVKNFEDGKYGGYDNYGDGGFMSMDRYGSPPIPNGKIYQTVSLKAAKYIFAAEFESFGIVDQAYLMAAEGNTLPDVDNLASSLGYTTFYSPSFEFIVDTDKEVTLGILGDLHEDRQWFRLTRIRLYKYQNIFE